MRNPIEGRPIAKFERHYRRLIEESRRCCESLSARGVWRTLWKVDRYRGPKEICPLEGSGSHC